ncbi:MAG TPA: phosphatase PAP2 family protein [Gaiellaceae bacterium]|nr:phosphatase PAP2 family protein [Gaiellaceae bacterium]
MSRGRAAALAAGAVAYAALALLVAAGRLTSIDRWAVYHAMPGEYFRGARPTIVNALVPLWGTTWNNVTAVVTNLVTLPAALLLATAVVVAACAALRGRAAVALAAAYVAGNAVEELTKATLTRPALYWHGLHLAAFDNSFPSGHTIRTVLVATAVGWAWPRAARWAALWAACSVAMLELGGAHVPSDIVGGLLLAGPLVLAARALR